MTRYTLIRYYLDKRSNIQSEQVDCKTIKEAVSLGSILSRQEKLLGSFILDNVTLKRLTLEGKEE